MAREPKARPVVAGVASAERVLSILTAFQHGDGALSLAELAQRTGLVKSTIMRMAVSLEQSGLVVRTVEGGYRLGGEIMRLGAVYAAGLDLEQQIQPVLHDLTQRTGETASFWVRQGDQRMCLCRENSPQALRLDVELGTLRALDKSSSAQVLVFFGAAKPAKGRPPALPFYSSGAHTPHVGSLAVPVFNQSGLVGALSISGPSARLSRERARDVAPLLIEAATDLTRSLGGLQQSIYRSTKSAA